MIVIEYRGAVVKCDTAREAADFFLMVADRQAVSQPRHLGAPHSATKRQTGLKRKHLTKEQWREAVTLPYAEVKERFGISASAWQRHRDKARKTGSGPIAA